MIRDSRHCKHCGGTGRAPLRNDLQYTLNACIRLDMEGAAICARHVGNMLRPRPNPSALSNRLRTLEALGYLAEDTRTRGGILYVLKRRK